MSNGISTPAPGVCCPLVNAVGMGAGSVEGGMAEGIMTLGAAGGGIGGIMGGFCGPCCWEGADRMLNGLPPLLAPGDFGGGAVGG